MKSCPVCGGTRFYHLSGKCVTCIRAQATKKRLARRFSQFMDRDIPSEVCTPEFRAMEAAVMDGVRFV